MTTPHHSCCLKLVPSFKTAAGSSNFNSDAGAASTLTSEKSALPQRVTEELNYFVGQWTIKGAGSQGAINGRCSVVDARKTVPDYRFPRFRRRGDVSGQWYLGLGFGERGVPGRGLLHASRSRIDSHQDEVARCLHLTLAADNYHSSTA